MKLKEEQEDLEARENCKMYRLMANGKWLMANTT